MEIRRSDVAGENVISITGTMEAQDAGVLKELRKTPGIRYVALNSPGGSLATGLALGFAIREAGLRTLLEPGAFCASACSLAFLGGFDAKEGKPFRLKANNSRLGFHSFRIVARELDSGTLGRAVADVQRNVYLMLNFFRRVEASTEILEAVYSTPTESLTYLSNGELVRLGVGVYDESGKVIAAYDYGQPIVLRPWVRSPVNARPDTAPQGFRFVQEYPEQRGNQPARREFRGTADWVVTKAAASALRRDEALAVISLTDIQAKFNLGFRKETPTAPLEFIFSIQRQSAVQAFEFVGLSSIAAVDANETWTVFDIAASSNGLGDIVGKVNCRKDCKFGELNEITAVLLTKNGGRITAVLPVPARYAADLTRLFSR